MEIRNLQLTDTIPYDQLSRGGIEIGWEKCGCDPEWTWVAVKDNHIVGLLVTGYCFPMLLLLRIAATPDAPSSTTLLLLRQALREARRRGLAGYLTFLSDSAAAEGKLMRIVQRSGGSLLASSGVWAYGQL